MHSPSVWPRGCVRGADCLPSLDGCVSYQQNELTTLGKLQGKETGTIEEAMELQVHRDQVGYDQHGLPSSPSPPGPAMEVGPNHVSGIALYSEAEAGMISRGLFHYNSG